MARISQQDLVGQSLAADSYLAVVKGGQTVRSTPLQLFDTIDELGNTAHALLDVLPVQQAASSRRTTIEGLLDYLRFASKSRGDTAWGFVQGSGYGGGTGGIWAVGGSWGGSNFDTGALVDETPPTATTLSAMTCITGTDGVERRSNVFSSEVITTGLAAVFRCNFQFNNPATARLSFGFYPSGSQATHVVDAPTATDYFLLQYSASRGDATWQVVRRRNSGAQTLTATAVAPTLGVHDLFFRVLPGVAIEVWLDGARLARILDVLPRDTVPQRCVMGVANPSAADDRRLWIYRAGYVTRDQ